MPKLIAAGATKEEVMEAAAMAIPQIANRGGLQHEPEPAMITAPVTDQRPISVIEQEEPLQIRPRRHTLKPAIRADLRPSQKLRSHKRLR